MIDYEKIASAVDHYKGYGYQYLDVPWMVREDSIRITLPDNRESFRVSGHASGKQYGHLVASGEQSLLEIRGDLSEHQKYLCVTPCFRDEHRADPLHKRYFLKVELMEVVPHDLIKGQFSFNVLEAYAAPKVKRMMYEASRFLMAYVPTSEVPMLAEPNSICAFDLQCEEFELGSYGVRWTKDFDFAWIYGTGCAEPRLSQVQAIWQERERGRMDERRRRIERLERCGPEVRGRKAARRHKKASR